MPSIDRNSPKPFYQQVYTQIAEGIESGLYPAGKKLPSIRECARALSVSNTTIEQAYQKLTELGYVQARRGSGFTICEIDTTQGKQSERFSPEYLNSLEKLKQMEECRQHAEVPAYDFAYDTIDRTVFPFTAWARMSREVFFIKGAEKACFYNDRQGLPELRKQITSYLNSEYGLNCTHEQILVMPTTRDLVSAIACLFPVAETRFALENPGYDEVAKRLHSLGFEVSPFSVNPFPSWEDARKELEGASVVFTTPSCQFPTNRPMPPEFRKELVEWAQRTGAYIIDDEYGWEFQLGIARTPSLATFDRTGHVITIGTFSNSFTPAISLSYAVLPPQLMLKWQEEQRDSHSQVPWQTQAAMAMFMDEGLWRTHIRKARTTMIRKRQKLLDAVKACFGPEIDVLSGPTSLFVLLQTHDGRKETELIAAAATEGVRVYPTNRYWQDCAPDDWRYVLVGFAGIDENDIEPGIRALSRAWGF